ncbi:hypothetical protein PTW35_19960 (plasmid) [Photobacterium sp. DA100]|uniref:hypothetical protein n=1 Tax=Photobacterium sp. DA100 TaxID=3027472 RepID=UPI0024792B73|nr:hypothetical protein [Photobacterium sp. DA100]WEM45359.1 hypothetical protein PTW35_19960 [Photobacterium sp. DA100]
MAEFFKGNQVVKLLCLAADDLKLVQGGSALQLYNPSINYNVIDNIHCFYESYFKLISINHIDKIVRYVLSSDVAFIDRENELNSLASVCSLLSSATPECQNIFITFSCNKIVISCIRSSSIPFSYFAYTLSCSLLIETLNLFTKPRRNITIDLYKPLKFYFPNVNYRQHKNVEDGRLFDIVIHQNTNG